MAAPEGMCAESGLLQLASSRSSLSRSPAPRCFPAPDLCVGGILIYVLSEPLLVPAVILILQR
ncbi:hypothetical protein NQZ68_000314 [Dissostichus eleginoides]|nr:hypothetical protein NQZ68_000314 [Dissostichus eleginoides]